MKNKNDRQRHTQRQQCHRLQPIERFHRTFSTSFCTSHQTLAASRFSPSDFLSRDSIHDVQMHTDSKKLRQTASVCSASESVTIDTTTESLVHPVLTAPP
jgi:hypothetical protein